MPNPDHTPPGPLRLWLRAETRATERRAPLVPADARQLTSQGITVTVEESPQRVFPLAEYVAAGCQTAPEGSWPDAPAGDYIIGLKELPEAPAELTHRHIYFGHAYKGQDGAAGLLRRFAAGGGALLDLEYLADARGRRLAAFGYWAGYIGAALAVLQFCGRLAVPLQPLVQPDLDRLVREAAAGAARQPEGDYPPRALVIGALGRSGRGAVAALRVAGIEATGWDLAETRELDRAALLAHHILVNTVLVTGPVPPFLRAEDADDSSRALRLVCDVALDVTSPFNPLPVYQQVTTWTEPVHRVAHGDVPLDVIAIDNLPSLLPAEASIDFSGQLTPQLMALVDLAGAPAWQRCLDAFAHATQPLGSEARHA